jgi:NADPH:quinone reductase-like Zn-dependent oxidoreductase
MARRVERLRAIMNAPSQRLLTILGVAALCLRGHASTQASGTGADARMKAIVFHEYGSPDVLRLEEIDKPVPGDDEVLVRVRAASVNPFDWHMMRGTPRIMRLGDSGFFRPKVTRIGVDFAGTVEAVGENVTQFEPGDDVFGGRTGAFAEYVCVREDRAIVHKPANITFEQAASVPIAAITALQGLRDQGHVQPGQKILINGASGGVGTFAVQIGKSLGVEVTGVCSTRNVEMVRSIGADHVVDYTKEDFADGTQRYDLMFDCVGNRSIFVCRRVLGPEGKYIMIGGPSGQWTRPILSALAAVALSKCVSQDMGMFMADMNKQDLAVLGDLMQSGKVTPVIDRRYKLSEVPDAIRYLEEGHARGKVVITLEEDDPALPIRKNFQTVSASIGPELTLASFLAIAIGAPIAGAIALNRRFQRLNPGKRPFRWGYYFSLQALVAGICLGIALELGVAVLLGCILLFAWLAWSFARRRHWAWVALTVISLNPLAWIVNAIYLWKRWREDVVTKASA